MFYSLTNNQEIYLVLCELVNDPYIAQNILNFKNEIEKKNALEYHTNRWENICSKYFKEIDTKKFPQDYSIIFIDPDEQQGANHYSIKIDHDLDFFKETRISYQIISLIHRLIKGNKYNYKINDKQEGILSSMLMDEMKQLKL